MTHQSKTFWTSSRVAGVLTALSVVAPIGGYWTAGVPAEASRARVVHHDANHPITQTPIFAQDPGFVEPVFEMVGE